MKYGCIGEHLKHSFSKEIHSYIGDYEYEIMEIAKDDVDAFMRKKDFLAINVTIPYKETVIPYLSFIDESARLIGAVNTIVNRGGELYGYNTDFFGMQSLAKRANIDFWGKKVLILGTGGTSKTAYAVAKHEGAKEIIKVSRRPSNDTVLYTDIYKNHTDAEIIINTTPVGMYPNIFDKPIELGSFTKLSGVIDAIYNPQNTPLVLEAKKLGIKAVGGLYMLVAQGVLASEYFLDTRYDSSILEDVFTKTINEKKNIVLIGMPSSGKSTVGKILREKLSRELIDTDELIVKTAGMPISEIFAKFGEAKFRDIETSVIKKISERSGVVIATGGGAILREENLDALRENGKLFFIDRPLDMLIPTKDRPTASDRASIEKRYSERYEIYCSAADFRVDGSKEAKEVADEILKNF